MPTPHDKSTAHTRRRLPAVAGLALLLGALILHLGFGTGHDWLGATAQICGLVGLLCAAVAEPA